MFPSECRAVVSRGGVRRVAVGVMVAVLVAGCGGDDLVSPTPTLPAVTVTTTTQPVAVTSTTAPVDVTTAVTPVFTALASRDVAALDAVVAAGVVPGSPAGDYLAHRATAEAVLAAAGVERAAVNVVADPAGGVGFTLCVDVAECVVYDAIEVDAAARLVSFAVDQVPVSELVIPAGPVVAVDGAQARVVSAAVSSSGEVSVVVEVIAGDEAVDVVGVSAVHRPRFDTSASAREVRAVWADGVVDPGESLRALMVFAEGPLDGDVVLSVVFADGRDELLALPLLAP